MNPSHFPKPEGGYGEHESLGEEMFPEGGSVASANECTGLMFTPPETKAQWEAYQELSPWRFPRRHLESGKGRGLARGRENPGRPDGKHALRGISGTGHTGPVPGF